MLDRHNFEKVESNNSLDSLYNKIFAAGHSKDSTEVKPAGFSAVEDNSCFAIRGYLSKLMKDI